MYKSGNFGNFFPNRRECTWEYWLLRVAEFDEIKMAAVKFVYD